MQNKILVAGAGAGKTEYIVNEALKDSDKRILITTFTTANTEEIRERLIKKAGCIPANVDVISWFSFLLKHGARPFQGGVYDTRVKGVVLPAGVSARFMREANVRAHYFATKDKIYSDKLAKFSIKCNRVHNGEVIKRLEGVYGSVYVDELQDMASYDLDFIKLIAGSKINLELIGDTRQGTYSTGAATNKKQRQDKTSIVEFFTSDTSLDFELDDNSLNINRRCGKEICIFSNSLYPDMTPVEAKSTNDEGKAHQGLFAVLDKDAERYIRNFEPVQIKRNKSVEVDDATQALNFGESKGLEFNRVIIYTTGPIRDWLQDGDSTRLKPKSKAELYVAITRAKHSVAFIVKDTTKLPDSLTVWA